ncbi:sodium glucose cotransporter 1-like [Limosa lapponica baueri]|uniref:Sodium glucose cotransporter 1-like n=1 Tax=Limosa lapponica baueri TaxID=1758121 RepID=A0A2I0UTE4_LIMLA|nr:sodium glucose cotransporter 1-like [Limosa lapponica baueri]
MKFKKAKCKVLHLHHGNPKQKYRLCREWIESSPEGKELVGVLVDEKLDMSQEYAFHSPEGQLNLKLHQKKCGQQVQGGDSTPLLCSGVSSPGVLCPGLEFPTSEGHGPVGMSPEEGHEGDQRAGAPLL